jgi:hypothetical protein
MSHRQIDALYLSVPRDDHGYPAPTSTAGKKVTWRQLHQYRCFLLGIRDPETVALLWNEQEVKRRAAAPPKKGSRRDRR